MTAAAPPELTGNITVFVLAIVIGYYVIGHVHHALHTPLMSITNAISGIIVVGALLQIGTGDTVVTVLAFVGDPAGEHQHLRRLRRHPPHAGDVPAMTIDSIAIAAYLVAALLFIMSLAGLSKHETAKQGIWFGISGMAIALVRDHRARRLRRPWREGMTTIGIVLMAVAVVAGAVIGLWRARVVQMTGMPELIALLHSFVGLAAVLVGWAATTPSRRRATRRPRSRRTCWASTTARSSSASSSVR